jgi:hypothetical protein
MTVQVIINSAQSIEFDRRRIIGQSVSRSERIRTAERASAQAFKFMITPVARFRYSLVRSVLESIQYYDRSREQVVALSANSNLWYINQYQGACTQAQLNAMTITNYSSATITIGTLPSVTSSTKLFRAGDWIQPEGSRYPYIVVFDVSRGSDSTVNVELHRPIITSENYDIRRPILVGTATTMVVMVTELPTYRLVEKDWAEFNGDFTLVESIV